jgi:benzoyl-CoA reductase/2-hydroxyglutaryl-CoA dehydratase subunit BcrC/BadD/HgdB
MLGEGIRKANRVRSLLARIRDLSYGTIPAPFPALETQICEMLALHFCSDLDECIRVLVDVLATIERRAAAGEGVLSANACRAVWVNPVADLRAMNLFEEMGGAIAGTEYLFRHALIPIPEDRPPLIALAETALRDPMIGTAGYRARIVVDEARRFGAEGVVVSAIPGASHSATEGLVIRQEVQRTLGLPVLEITVPPLVDATLGQLTTRFEGFFDIIRSRRHRA